MTTTQLGNTTVMLDELYQSYSQIFESATSQLESIDLTDEHVKRIGTSLVEDHGLRQRLSQSVSTQLRGDMCRDDGSELRDRIADRAADFVIEKVKESIAEWVDIEVRRHLASERTQEMMDRLVRMKPEVKQAIEAEAAVKQLRAVMATIE